MATLIRGWGFNVGQDFARAIEDTPIEIVETRGSTVYGDIAGSPNARLGFMRAARIRVRCDIQSIRKDTFPL